MINDQKNAIKYNMSKINKKGFVIHLTMNLFNRCITITKEMLKNSILGIGRSSDTMRLLDKTNNTFWASFNTVNGNAADIIAGHISKYKDNHTFIGFLFSQCSLIAIGLCVIFTIVCIGIYIYIPILTYFIYGISIMPIIYSTFVSAFCSTLLNIQGHFFKSSRGVVIGNLSSMTILVISKLIYDWTSINVSAYVYGIIYLTKILSLVNIVRYVKINQKYICFIPLIINTLFNIFHTPNIISTLIQLISTIIGVTALKSDHKEVTIISSIITTTLNIVSIISYSIVSINTLPSYTLQLINLLNVIICIIHTKKTDAISITTIIVNICGIVALFTHRDNISYIIYALFAISQLLYTIIQSIDLYIAARPFMQKREKDIITPEMYNEKNQLIKSMIKVVLVQSPQRIIEVILKTSIMKIYNGFSTIVDQLHKVGSILTTPILLGIRSSIQNISNDDEEFAIKISKIIVLGHLLLMPMIFVVINPNLSKSLNYLLSIFTRTKIQTDINVFYSLFCITIISLYFEVINHICKNILSIKKKYNKVAQHSFLNSGTQILIVLIAYAFHQKLMPNVFKNICANYELYAIYILQPVYLIPTIIETIAVITSSIKSKLIKLDLHLIYFIIVSTMLGVQITLFPLGIINYIINIATYILLTSFYIWKIF